MTLFIREFLSEFWAVLTDMSPYLILGFVMAGILSVLISQKTVEKHIGGRGAWPVVKASLFGIPLPLCSCGVIPVGMSLRRQGAGRGAATSFIISTPETGVDSLLVTYSLLGPLFAIIKAVTAFVLGVVGGILVNLWDGREERANERIEVPAPVNCTGACCTAAAPGSRPARAARYAFVDLPRDIGSYLFWGLIAAAAITAIIPENYFEAALGRGIAPMLLMMAVGVPMYVCATASVPIAAAFMAAGVSPGAALVFLMTGPATNAAAISSVWSVLGRRAALIYLGVITAGSLASGLLLDALTTGVAARVAQTAVFELPAWFNNASAAVLIAMLVPAMIYRHQNRNAGAQCTDSASHGAPAMEPAPAHAVCSSHGCSCGGK
jgi:uncharacterized membrane protein YraQ (UPF0718 family)